MGSSRRPPLSGKPSALSQLGLVAFAAFVTLCSSSCSERASGPRVQTAPDVIVIVIDALRPDHLASHGYERETDPALTELADDSVLFEQAFAAAPKTMPSVPQLLSSSLFPDATRPTTLMGAAQAAGYTDSLAVISSPRVARWVGRLEPSFGKLITDKLSAGEIVDAALQWFERPTQAPRLAYLHFLDTSIPYDVPPPFNSKFIDADYRGALGTTFEDVDGAQSGAYGEDDQRRIVDLYDGTIAYVDAQLGRLLGGLTELGLYDNAVIIVTADHGEEFWDHGSFLHGQSLYDELLHVPLMVKYPHAWRGGTRARPLVSSLDILPTIADMMTAATSSSVADARWQGRLLSDVFLPQPQTAPRTLFATVGRADLRRPPRHCVRSTSHKLIVNLVDGTRELYDLENDPPERRNVIAIGQEPPRELLVQYQTATAMLSEVAYQLELTNTGDEKLSYELELQAQPAAQIVNLHRVDLGRNDSLAITGNATTLQWKGRLAAGETDRVRFDLLAHSGALSLTLTIDGHLAEAGAIRIGSWGIPADTNPAVIHIATIDGPRSAAMSARAAFRALLPNDGDGPPAILALWRSGDSQAVLPPVLADEEPAPIPEPGEIK